MGLFPNSLLQPCFRLQPYNLIMRNQPRFLRDERNEHVRYEGFLYHIMRRSNCNLVLQAGFQVPSIFIQNAR